MIEQIRWVSTAVAVAVFCVVEVLLLRTALLPGPSAPANGLSYRPGALEFFWTALPALVLGVTLVVSIAWGAFS